MEVRVRQQPIGGVVHVRGQELTHKVAVDVRLGRHVVGETNKLLHAHMTADSNFVNKVRSDFGDVKVLKRVANKSREREISSSGPLQILSGQNFVFGEKVHRENETKKQSLFRESSHGNDKSVLFCPEAEKLEYRD